VAILLILGVVALFFAKSLANVMLGKLPQNHKFNTPIFRSLLYVWPIRVIGLICLVFAFLISFDNPPSRTGSDVNRLLLLENGKTVEATVYKTFYQHLAPSGWKVVYNFKAKSPTNDTEKLYWGSAQGPKEYYANLVAGNPVELIYCPSDPKINCEIRYFLNNPSFRATFKKAGKLQLLDKFKDKYKLEDYSFEEWYRLQRQK
jgi:hypothetical protein